MAVGVNLLVTFLVGWDRPGVGNNRREKCQTLLASGPVSPTH